MAEVPNIGGKNMGMIAVIAVVVIVVVIGVVLSDSIIEVNDAGYYQVMQAFGSGDLSVRNRAGMYFQGFAKITTYPISFEIYLSKDDLDGGEGADTQAVSVRFGDGGTADLSSVTKVRVTMDTETQLKLHSDFKNFQTLRANLRQYVISIQKQVSSLFKAEETYSTRRVEYYQMIQEQIVNGKYATFRREMEEISEDGTVFRSEIVDIKYDDDGNPVVLDKSFLEKYGLELVYFELKDIDFDDKIDELIAQKKEAEQEQVVAKAKAEKARQDAITAEEEGKARVAKAKADEEVEKIKAVTKAMKEKEVSLLNAEREYEAAKFAKLQAEQEAEALRIRKEAEAAANRLLVQAGLTPREKADIDMKTAIGVAEMLASIKLPELMIIGGGEGGNLDPFQAIGLDTFRKIAADMSSGK